MGRLFETFRLRMWVFLARLLPGSLVYWLPQPRPFEPRAIDQAAARREIEAIVGVLAPDATDEATGHVMDRLIDVWTEAWVAELAVDFQRHGLRNARTAMIAAALAAREAVLNTDARRRHDELTMAHQAALNALISPND
ncbi:hypothetical protein AB0H83_14915 [Dactylosporangium sp. NPDC050688]|uniref:hypothetical protein n=1 Tax=Dactylosporangium sp. NPDC050688 TaxID=3157217 RepID=UPI0033D59131